MATPVLACGFECGQLGTVGQHWSIFNGAPAFDTSTVRNGARSLRCNASGATVWVTRSITSTTAFVARFAVRFATLPSADATIFLAGASLEAEVRFKSSDGKIYASANDGGTLGATGVAVTTGVWYFVDLKADVSANPHLIDVKVSGTACGQASRAVAASSIANVYVGVGNAVTADVYYDDIVLSATLADYPFGDGYVNHFIPVSDGTHNVAGANDFERTITGTDITNATTTAFQLVDDVPLESGGGTDWINMIAPPNATDYVKVVIGPAPGISTPTAGPRAVEVIAAIHQNTTANGNMEIRLDDSATLNAIYSATTVAGTTNLIYKRKHYATSPKTGTAWNSSGFNALQVEFGSPTVLDVTPDQYFDCIMFEAEFAAVVAAAVVGPPWRRSISQAVTRAANF